MEENHIIKLSKKLIDALKQLNSFLKGPLVLFVVDDEEKMVGTLTDGDSRRALIAGVSVNDSVENVMHMIDDDCGYGYILDLPTFVQMNAAVINILNRIFKD